jgi:phosphoribosyl 1,2-cyclic phosphate phosphodiesterase
MKNASLKITFLGTGANGGTPQVDCRCKNCINNSIVRKRSSILIECANERLLVDCGPDFHSQLISHNLRLFDLDAIVISHLHWDHCLGLVDLSSGEKLNIPIIVDNKLLKDLTSNHLFSFLFAGGWASIKKHFTLIKIKFIGVKHDPKVATFAIKLTYQGKNVLIATDLSAFNRKLLNEIKSANLVIFDGTFLSENKHSHMAIDNSAPILSKLNNRVVFTHINHSEDETKIRKHINKFGFDIAHDGQAVEI